METVIVSDPLVQIRPLNFAHRELLELSVANKACLCH